MNVKLETTTFVSASSAAHIGGDAMPIARPTATSQSFM